MVSVIQLNEIDRPEHRSASSKPMVCATETYGFWSPNLGGWESRVAKRLIHNALAKPPNYGRFCEKIF